MRSKIRAIRSEISVSGRIICRICFPSIHFKHNMLDYIDEVNTIYSMLTMIRYLYGLKGNSVYAEAVPATVSVDDC